MQGGSSEETEYVDKHRATAATKGEDIKKGWLRLSFVSLKKIGEYQKKSSAVMSLRSYLYLLLRTAQSKILRLRTENKSEVIIVRLHKFKVIELE